MRGLFRRPPVSRRPGRKARLAVEPLEGRIVPTTNLVLDFAGGAVRSTDQFDTVPAAEGINFSPFAALQNGDGSAGNRTEQIEQIVAGVRESYARFDVNVVWDDRGVKSPLFRPSQGDSVIMVVQDDPAVIGGGGGEAGIAPFDTAQGTTFQSADVGFVFASVINQVDPGRPATETRELIETISHESGHTFGLDHTLQPDATRTQIMDPGTDPNAEDRGLPPRFSTQVSPLESGGSNSETGRLNQTVGAARVPNADTQTAETLAPAAPAVQVSASVATTASGAVDYAGDRDAFQFAAPVSGPITVALSALPNSPLVPDVTIWDSAGNFVADGGAGGATSSVTFAATAGTTYFAVAGSSNDPVQGALASSNVGAYTLTIGPAGLVSTGSLGTGTGAGTAAGTGNPTSGGTTASPATGSGTGTPSSSGTSSGSGSQAGSASDSSGQGASSTDDANAQLNQLVIAALRAVFAQPIPPGSPVVSASITSIDDFNGDGFDDVAAMVVFRVGRHNTMVLRVVFDGLSTTGGLIGAPTFSNF